MTQPIPQPYPAALWREWLASREREPTREEIDQSRALEQWREALERAHEHIIASRLKRAIAAGDQREFMRLLSENRELANAT